MLKHKLILLVMATATLSHAQAFAADARGLALTADKLTSAQRTKLQHAVSADRLARPTAYDINAVAKGCRPEGWMVARTPEPNCGRDLRALGPAGLLPMLNALALDWTPQGLSTEPAQRAKEERALTVGLLEAIGSLRDVRARPVLHALWQQSRTQPEARIEMGRQMTVARATAEALGRLGGSQELKALEVRLQPGDSLYLAAIAGLGVCKRAESAQLLVNALAHNQDEQTQRWIVQAMGALASSWSWQTLGQIRAKDALMVQTRVTDALLPQLATTQGESRERVVQSLQLADLPELPARLVAMRSNADAVLQRDIDDLLNRLARAHASH